MKHKLFPIVLLGSLVLLVSAIVLAMQAPVATAEPPPTATPATGAHADALLAVAVGTAFTYQGRLTSGGTPVNGTCDLQFSLWDAGTGGGQIGTTQTKASVTVSDGLFTVFLDFGAAFTGDARWLEIAVRCPAGSGSYTFLTPRQQLTPGPYALALPGLRTEQNATSPNVIGGHRDNSVTAGVWGATISGGGNAGYLNSVTALFGTIGGGEFNIVGGEHATVGGGSYNRGNTDHATVGGGYSNVVGGNYATVPGGYMNQANGDYSFAAGRNAIARDQGCFVWSDSSGREALRCIYANRWIARASGGVYFYTNSDLTAGARLASGSSAWAVVSDRAAKANFAPVNGREILTRLAAIPIQTWNWKSQDASIRHIGPVAQDFAAAFNVGEDDLHITTVDADGVALAAIQGLYEIVQEQDARISQLEKQVGTLEQRVAALEARSGSQPAQAEAFSLDWGVLGFLLVGLAVGLVVRRR